VNEQKPVDHFTIIPRRFTDAHIADEIDHLHVLIGLHIAARCYEVRNTSHGVAAIRLASLAELCGNTSTETIRRKLHELEPEWIACEVEPGQRSAWRIRLTGLAHEADTNTAPPHDLHRTSTKEPPPVWRFTSTDLEPGGGANPHGETASGATRLPHGVFERPDKRNETKRNDDERKAGIEGKNGENLDTAVGETTVAADFDPIERARQFDEMFPPRARRAS
jgi:hypothetical protein